MTRWRAIPAAVAGVVVGAVVTLAVGSSGAPPGSDPTAPSGPSGSLPEVGERTYLAWVPRGLPTGFGRSLAAHEGIEASTVVAEDIVWLDASWSAAGERVDEPPAGYRIPLDVAAVAPDAFASFVGEAERPAIAAVADGQAVLSTTGAALRGLGPGAMLGFARGHRLRVADVLPDALVGAAEILVSRDVGRRIGVVHERYALVRPSDPSAAREDLKAMIRPLLPPTLGIDRKVQVRAPGDTPYFRAGDAVLPLAAVKTAFGEFSARPKPNVPGGLEVDPDWLHANIVSARLPAIGRISACHRAVLPQLRHALRELVDRGLQDVVRSYHGCFVPRYIGSDPANMLSFHSWGIAIDVNLSGNWRGQTPGQPTALVRTLERWGFTWGGRWLVPDGSHFEFHRFP
jgi:hypothetical protein